MLYRLTALLLLMFLNGTAVFAADYHATVVPLERNGLRLHLQRLERTQAPQGAPLLLLHGLTYSSHEFDVDVADYSLARFFARNGYAVWTLDIAGYGSSQKPEDGFATDSSYAAKDIAAAARVILEQSGAKRLYVLGWSWGTVTAGKFAATHPELVEKLVLYAPILSGLGEGAVSEPFHRNTWEHAAGDFQTDPDGSIDYNVVEPGVAAAFLANCWRYDGAGSPNGGRRELLVAPETRLIDTTALRSPTLLISGDKDGYVNLPLCAESVAALPEGSKYALIAGGGHAMMLEKQTYTEFRETVLRFLSGN